MAFYIHILISKSSQFYTPMKIKVIDIKGEGVKSWFFTVNDADMLIPIIMCAFGISWLIFVESVLKYTLLRKNEEKNEVLKSWT